MPRVVFDHCVPRTLLRLADVKLHWRSSMHERAPPAPEFSVRLRFPLGQLVIALALPIALLFALAALRS